MKDLAAIARTEAAGKSIDPATIERLVDSGIDADRAEALVAVCVQAEKFRKASEAESALEQAAIKAESVVAKADAHATAQYFANRDASRAAHYDAMMARAQLDTAVRAKRELALLRWNHPELFGPRPT
ncbi:MAG: hypothetical protein H0W83_01175, partial [Planctomycetes bacterium]|nr:hypothetical protein [Planctomycetota bacterium]